MNIWSPHPLDEQVTRALSSLEYLRIDPRRLEPLTDYAKVCGGFGIVRVAKLDDQLVAVKQLHIPGDDIDRARFAMRFARELKVWAILDHPNVLSLRGFYLCPEIITAQYISAFHPYGHLGIYLSQHKPDMRKRRELAEDTALGLKYLHGLKIVHGDLKEGNVLVNSHLRAILCDYGLAKIVDDDNIPSGFTTSNVPISARFSSPELINGSPRRVPSDIWAWGCLFLRIVANIMPYADAILDVTCILRIGRGDPPADASSLNLHVSLQSMLSSCWNPNEFVRPSIAQCVAIIKVAQPPRRRLEAQFTELQPWDSSSAVFVKTLHGHWGGVNSVTFSPDGSLLASGSGDRKVQITDVNSGMMVANLDCNTFVDAVAFSPNGTRLASGSSDGGIRIWDTISGTSKLPSRTYISWVETTAISTGAAVCFIAFSPDGSLLAAGLGLGTVRVWNGETGIALFTFSGHEDAIWGISFSPEGDRLASCSEDKTVRIWDIVLSTSPEPSNSGSRAVATLIGHRAGVRSVAFSPSGGLLASGSTDQTIRVYSKFSWPHLTAHEDGIDDALNGINEGPCLVFPCSGARSLVFSPDGARLAFTNLSSQIEIWDTTSWTFVMTLDSHNTVPSSISFSPDGSRIAAGSCGGSVRIWHATAVVAGTK